MKSYTDKRLFKAKSNFTVDLDKNNPDIILIWEKIEDKEASRIKIEMTEDEYQALSGSFTNETT